MEHSKHERGVQSECTSGHDERVEVSRKEAVEANDKWGKKVAKFFGKLSTKVKIALVVVKVVTAYLPKAQVGEPQLDNSKFGYLPENATADIKDVLSLCRKDAADEVDKKEIKKQADASLRDTVKALTLPLIEGEYELDFKPLADYKGEADSNA